MCMRSVLRSGVAIVAFLSFMVGVFAGELVVNIDATNELKEGVDGNSSDTVKNHPPIVYFVLDMSTSMQSTYVGNDGRFKKPWMSYKRYNVMYELVKERLKDIPKNSEIYWIKFSGNAGRPEKPISLDDVQEKLKDLDKEDSYDGITLFYDTLANVLTDIRKRSSKNPQLNVTVFVFTDGCNFTHKNSAKYPCRIEHNDKELRRTIEKFERDFPEWKDPERIQCQSLSIAAQFIGTESDAKKVGISTKPTYEVRFDAPAQELKNPVEVKKQEFNASLSFQMDEKPFQKIFGQEVVVELTVNGQSQERKVSIKDGVNQESFTLEGLPDDVDTPCRLKIKRLPDLKDDFKLNLSKSYVDFVIPKKNSVAIDTVTPASGKVFLVGTPIHFSASGTKGATFQWTFSTGDSASGSSFTKAFSKPGKIKFSVTASKAGLTPATTPEIGVKIVSADFVITKDKEHPVAPAEVTFHATPKKDSLVPTGYSWHIIKQGKDGGTHIVSGEGEQFKYQFSNPGDYTIETTASYDGILPKTVSTSIKVAGLSNATPGGGVYYYNEDNALELKSEAYDVENIRWIRKIDGQEEEIGEGETCKAKALPPVPGKEECKAEIYATGILSSDHKTIVTTKPVRVTYKCPHAKDADKVRIKCTHASDSQNTSLEFERGEGVNLVLENADCFENIEWDCGDGKAEKGANVTHRFEKKGEYKISVGYQCKYCKTAGKPLSTKIKQKCAHASYVMHVGHTNANDLSSKYALDETVVLRVASERDNNLEHIQAPIWTVNGEKLEGSGLDYKLKERGTCKISAAIKCKYCGESLPLTQSAKDIRVVCLHETTNYRIELKHEDANNLAEKFTTVETPVIKFVSERDKDLKCIQDYTWTLDGVGKKGTFSGIRFEKGKHKISVSVKCNKCGENIPIDDKPFEVVCPCKGDLKIDSVGTALRVEKVSFELKNADFLSGIVWNFGDGESDDSDSTKTNHHYKIVGEKLKVCAKGKCKYCGETVDVPERTIKITKDKLVCKFTVEPKLDRYSTGGKIRLVDQSTGDIVAKRIWTRNGVPVPEWDGKSVQDTLPSKPGEVEYGLRVFNPENEASDADTFSVRVRWGWLLAIIVGAIILILWVFASIIFFLNNTAKAWKLKCWTSNDAFDEVNEMTKCKKKAGINIQKWHPWDKKADYLIKKLGLKDLSNTNGELMLESSKGKPNLTLSKTVDTRFRLCSPSLEKLGSGKTYYTKVKHPNFEGKNVYVAVDCSESNGLKNFLGFVGFTVVLLLLCGWACFVWFI